MTQPADDDFVVIDSATGTWLPGRPTPRLVEAGRGHAWQKLPGVWRMAEPGDDADTTYRAVVVGFGRQVCSTHGCLRAYPLPRATRYLCPVHARNDAPRLGVDKSTASMAQSPHQAATKPPAPGAKARKENPMSATATTKARKPSRREAIASGKTKVAAGMLAILNGEATAADVLDDVAADVPEVKPGGEARMQANGDVAARIGAALAAKADPVRRDAPVLPLITMEERDRILAGKDKALIARVEAGTYVRPNGKVPGGSVKSTGTDVKYYPRWRLAVDLTDAMLERVETVAPDAAWGWTNPDGRKPRERKVREVRESAAGAPALDPVKVEKVRKAKAVIEAADALPGPESIIAIGSPEAQDALEIAAAASLGAKRDDE